jgi:hypothetical protein
MATPDQNKHLVREAFDTLFNRTGQIIAVKGGKTAR